MSDERHEAEADREPERRPGGKAAPQRPLQATLDGVARTAADAFGADRAAIYLIDDREGDLQLRAGHGLPASAMGHRLAIGEGLTGRVARDGRSLISADVTEDPRSTRRRPDWSEDPVVRGYLGVPLRAGGNVIGAIELTSAGTDAFDPEQRGRASILADAAALLVERARLLSAPPPAARERGSAGSDPLGIATLNARLAVTSASPTFCRLVGQPVESLVGRPAVTILPALGRPEARDALEAALHGSPGHVSRVQLEPRAGGTGRRGHRPEPTVVSLSLIPVGDPARGVDGVMIAAQDITARARLEAELHEQTDRAVEARDRLRAVIEVVSHELRTPLTSVLGYARLLSDRTDADADKRARWAEQVTEKARLMARLVDEITDLARLGSASFTLERERHQVGPLIREVADEMAADAPLHLIETDVPASLPPVRIDRDRIAQVLNNLLANAVKFWPEGGTIRVTARREREAVAVSVIDRGPGIPEEHGEDVFEPFFRVTDGGPQVPGTGLGLAVCRGIVDAHGGTITWEPTPGGGSTFRFTLPIDLA